MPGTPTARAVSSKRWFAVSVFVASSTLNYLDRQLLSVLAPLIMAELHFNRTRFGLLLSAFSLAYAASSLFVGWFLDRAGVNRGISAAVAWWSLSAIGTGLVQNLPGLAVCRAALGIGESAGVPAVGKVNGLYLKPEERALGAAVNQIGLSLGLALAPLWIGVATSYSWRAPFVLSGVLGLLWIPLWLVVSRAIPYVKVPAEAPNLTLPKSPFSILLEHRMVVLVTANLLWMGAYSTWSNWTTLYLTEVHHLSLRQSASYVWIPPLISNLGAFFGGWLSLYWMRKTGRTIAARRNAVLVSAAGSLLTLALPLAPDARWATAVISVSFFFALAGSVNIYALPIDIWGPARSGLAIAALVFSFGVLQTFLSPIIGHLGDLHQYNQVVWFIGLAPMLSGLALLMLKEEKQSER